MNYLNFLEQKDIEEMLAKCNLKLNTNVDPIRTNENKSVALIFCEKIKHETEDKFKQDLISRLKNSFPLFREDRYNYFENNFILYLSNFELFDGVYEKDYTDVLYQTITSKLQSNPKILKKYKKDFIKYYKNLHKQNKEIEKSK